MLLYSFILLHLVAILYVISIASNDNPSVGFRIAGSLLRESFGTIHMARPVRTEPVGDHYPHQPFLNSAVAFRSSLPEADVRSLLKEIELTLGRDDSKRRLHLVPIDLDIIVVAGRVVHPDYLRLPFLPPLVQEAIPPDWLEKDLVLQITKRNE